MESIVVVMAMEAEAEPFVARIGASESPVPTRLPLRAFVTVIDGCRVAAVVNGRHPRHGVDHIGTDAAAVTTSIALTNFTPDLVITAGTAGARRGTAHRIGDVVLAAPHFVHHDRRIPLRGFDELGVGRFPAAPVGGLARRLGLGTGVFSTGNSFGETTADLEMLDASGAIAIDMESAAVASVGELHDVPVLGVRVLANYIGGGATGASEFESGLASAAARLADALATIIDFCATADVAALDLDAT